MDDMLLVSIGTGLAPQADEVLRPAAMNLLFSATVVPAALMGGALNEQDMLCRVFGQCRHGAQLDRESGTLCEPAQGIDGTPRLFSDIRYNGPLTTEGLGALGLGNIDPVAVHELDAVDNVGDLQRIGTAVAADVEYEHFEDFLP